MGTMIPMASGGGSKTITAAELWLRSVVGKSLQTGTYNFDSYYETYYTCRGTAYIQSLNFDLSKIASIHISSASARSANVFGLIGHGFPTLSVFGKSFNGVDDKPHGWGTSHISVSDVTVSSNEFTNSYIYFTLSVGADGTYHYPADGNILIDSFTLTNGDIITSANALDL